VEDLATILIVDDEPIVRAVLENLLGRSGRQLLSAADGEEALTCSEAAPSIEVAIVDKNLPGLSGLQVMRAIKARHPDVAGIIMTAYPTTESAAEAVRLGLFDYLSKPFENLAEIEAVVDRAIEKVRSSRGESQKRREVEEQGRIALATARRAMQEEIARTAAHDQLTGLLNRAAFVMSIDKALIAKRADPSRAFAVLVLDINDFGRINDSLGHTAGDQLLRQWAERVAALIRPDDVFARIGADQFTLILHNVHTAEEAVEVADRLRSISGEHLAVADRDVSMSVSVGINLCDSGYDHAEDMLRDAGNALVRAKAAGKGTHAVFAREMHSRAVELLILDQALKEAVARQEFVAHYQPILSVETGRLVAFEALARWQHPTRGLLAPDKFLTRASEVGALADISWQIADRACAQHRKWLDHFGVNIGLTINLNVAPPLLLKPGFVKDVDKLLAKYRLEPKCIKIEITEAVAIDNTAVSATIIQDLRHLGIVVCLDDFGTGFASLSWLHQFPVDELKIDKSFVADMTHNRRSHILVGAAISLAHSLGLPVVAEGVETEAQLKELRGMACEYVQGFLFSMALNVADAEACLARELALRH
jgi:diguanylate cyclase (GGDEF)-like protein